MKDGVSIPAEIPIDLEQASVISIDADRRRITHIISTARLDRGNRIVEPSGWQLENFKRAPRVLADHDYSIEKVIGRGHDLKVVDVPGIGQALVATTEFDEGGIGNVAFRLASTGMVNTWSVGWIGLKSHRIGELDDCERCDEEKNVDYGRHYVTQELLEYSLVAIPANPDVVNELQAAGLISTADVAEWTEAFGAPRTPALQNERLADSIRSVTRFLKTRRLSPDRPAGGEIKMRATSRTSPMPRIETSRDVESCCLDALGPEERQDIAMVARSIPSGKRNREGFSLLSNEVGSTLAAHWLWASARLQTQKYSTAAEKTQLWQAIDRYEKALMDAFRYEKAASLTTGTDTLGGHWIPDPVAAELYRLILDHSIFGRLASHVPMVSKTLDLPIEGSSALSVSWGSENTDITDSVPASNALNKVTLTANRLNGFATSSWEAIQDSPVSLLLWVRDKLTELAGREIDQEALEGTGSPFTGIVGASGVNEIASQTNGDLITYATLVDTVFKGREAASRDGARFFCSPEIAQKTLELTDDQARPIVESTASVAGGFPMEIHSVISSTRTWGTGTTLSHLYFGPPSAVVIGDRVGMAWDTSDVASDAFRKYQLHMRLITRLAIATAVPKAFTRRLNLQTT